MMRKLTLLFIFYISIICAKAQNGVNSPYSRYGFGVMSDRSMGFNKGLAGTAQGFRNGKEVNIANPASYSAVDSTTSLFDIGMTLQNGNYRMGNSQQNVKNSSFDYFVYQFRAARHVGVTVGLLPLSKIKYSFSSPNEVLSGTEATTSAYSYDGDGGLREVMMGVGWNPVRPLSVGVNASYVWGDYTHTMTMAFNESSINSVTRTNEAIISTYNLQAGVQYEQPLSGNKKIVVGATYSLGHNVNNDAVQSTASRNGSTTLADTTETIHNAFQFPHSIAAGITYYKSNTLRIGADFTLQKWGDCRFPSATANGFLSAKGALLDTKRVSAGVDWTPSTQIGNLRGLSFAKYLKTITYKLGAYYSTSYASADATGKVTDKPYEYGVSAGFSLPIRNLNVPFEHYSRINVTMQWVHATIPYLASAGAQPHQASLDENYLRLCLGITVNERWFYKWKLR